MTQQTLLHFKKIARKERTRNSGLYSFFNALGDPTRYTMFRLLVTHKGFCVSDMASVVDISIGAASQHLKLLENSGLVVRTRNGRRVCYKPNKKSKVVSSLTEMIVV